MESTGENKKIVETNQCGLQDELILEKFEVCYLCVISKFYQKILEIVSNSY